MNPPVSGIDFAAANWCQRRAILLWGGAGGVDAWHRYCAQARAEYRLAKWLAHVWGGVSG